MVLIPHQIDRFILDLLEPTHGGRVLPVRAERAAAAAGTGGAGLRSAGARSGFLDSLLSRGRRGVVVDGVVVVGVDGNQRRRWGSLYSSEPLYTRGTGTPTSSSARRWWATPSRAHRAARRGPGSRSLFASPSS